MPSKRSACAGLPLTQCAERSSTCTVVRRKGQPHHCRSKPHRRPTSSSRSSSSSRPSLHSAKAKVARAVRTVTRQCDALSLKQRNGTCFMAAATLVFARVALARCPDLGIRQYVRRSMANAWDEAQGRSQQDTCPRIPKSVRQHYADLLDRTHNKLGIFTSKGVACAATHSCKDKPLTDGGKSYAFLTALYWAAGMDLVLTKLNVKAGTDAETVSLLGSFLARETSRTTTTHLVNTRLFSKPLATESFVRRVLAEGVSRTRQVQSVVLVLVNDQRTRAHVVTLFPCFRRGALQWTFCNSWGDDCSRSLAQELRALAARGLDHVDGFDWLCT